MGCLKCRSGDSWIRNILFVVSVAVSGPERTDRVTGDRKEDWRQGQAKGIMTDSKQRPGIQHNGKGSDLGLLSMFRL